MNESKLVKVRESEMWQEIFQKDALGKVLLR